MSRPDILTIIVVSEIVGFNTHGLFQTTDRREAESSMGEEEAKQDLTWERRKKEVSSDMSCDILLAVVYHVFILVANVMTHFLLLLPLPRQVLVGLLLAHSGLSLPSVRSLEWSVGVKTDNLCNNNDLVKMSGRDSCLQLKYINIHRIV